ncbi:MAG: hypothetical protein PF440_07810 [Thiomicrorhabdus sp.]|jgi:hypothetical protein|nr:hypothetical protein [Thiomicrorhabdus sp.]
MNKSTSIMGKIENFFTEVYEAIFGKDGEPTKVYALGDPNYPIHIPGKLTYDQAVLARKYYRVFLVERAAKLPTHLRSFGTTHKEFGEHVCVMLNTSLSTSTFRRMTSDMRTVNSGGAYATHA